MPGTHLTPRESCDWPFAQFACFARWCPDLACVGTSPAGRSEQWSPFGGTPFARFARFAWFLVSALSQPSPNVLIWIIRAKIGSSTW